MNIDSFFNRDDSKDIEVITKHIENTAVFSLRFYGEVFDYKISVEELHELSAVCKPYELETRILNEILHQIPVEYHKEIITKIL